MSRDAPSKDLYAYRSDSYRTLITVKGMSTKPANTRAVAPVSMFCVFDNFGRTLLLLGMTPSAILKLVVPSSFAWLLATTWRRELRVLKYNADPKPVRKAEGRVPRQSFATGFGDASIERRTGRREEDRDCCTRVLSRSAGWSRTALDMPEANPAKK